MPTDIREDAARYYDLQENPPEDIPFYQGLVPSSSARVLELGCGTGRVLVPLAPVCGCIHGVDASAAMLSRCQEKLAQAGLPSRQASASQGDITDLDLGRQFDLIIAPFRVFQNLETDAQVDGLFRSIRRHLAPGGTAVLNTFLPYRDRQAMLDSWCDSTEHIECEIPLPEGKRLVKFSRRPQLNPEPLIVYPDLIYRLYSASGDVEDESVLSIAMRCWYPDELEDVVIRHGFRVVDRWGGYAGQVWGQGPELVLQFGA